MEQDVEDKTLPSASGSGKPSFFEALLALRDRHVADSCARIGCACGISATHCRERVWRSAGLRARGRALRNPFLAAGKGLLRQEGLRLCNGATHFRGVWLWQTEWCVRAGWRCATHFDLSVRRPGRHGAKNSKVSGLGLQARAANEAIETWSTYS
jgi:hypothetical protein